MNINIGSNRWVKFVRTPDGRWAGRGHGYRFRVTRHSATWSTHSEQWQCQVYVATGGPCIAGCLSSKMKLAIQEGTRRADVVAVGKDDTCPT